MWVHGTSQDLIDNNYNIFTGHAKDKRKAKYRRKWGPRLPTFPRKIKQLTKCMSQEYFILSDIIYQHKRRHYPSRASSKSTEFKLQSTYQWIHLPNTIQLSFNLVCTVWGIIQKNLEITMDPIAVKTSQTINLDLDAGNW